MFVPSESFVGVLWVWHPVSFALGWPGLTSRALGGLGGLGERSGHCLAGVGRLLLVLFSMRVCVCDV